MDDLGWSAAGARVSPAMLNELVSGSGASGVLWRRAPSAGSQGPPADTADTAAPMGPMSSGPNGHAAQLDGRRSSHLGRHQDGPGLPAEPESQIPQGYGPIEPLQWGRAASAAADIIGAPRKTMRRSGGASSEARTDEQGSARHREHGAERPDPWQTPIGWDHVAASISGDCVLNHAWGGSSLGAGQHPYKATKMDCPCVDLTARRWWGHQQPVPASLKPLHYESWEYCQSTSKVQASAL